MYESTYDIVALGMRYFFLLLILYILLRLVQHSVREFKAVQHIKQQVRSVSPGYLEVLSPEEHKGETFQLGRENTLGRSKRCDIQIQLPTLAPVHAFIYQKKKGLYAAGYGSHSVVLINGEKLKGSEELLYSQDTLEMGKLVVKLHLYGDDDDDETEVEPDAQ